MRAEIRMPNLGYDMETGIILTWLRKPGEQIERGEPIAEIETDKTNVEMESTQSGVVAELVVEEGSVVAVGSVIAIVETEP